ncbi:shikimate dehydrogenase family protein [Neotamlana laminarinivorans]|uniref:Shikimate dehydrogenase n=1 Tax=Neotamlana laminarinivorans TaxID=2883124 RepID=A0A9X1L0G7_9FLAO|nr:shikimate dehydrogenase [Tamlana laminarinivorans]MCB4797505.1 shikimate dehydrogenase [Tamlana laminarinivorans]
MKKLGLLGKNISYSFSRAYFKEKFQKEGINNIVYDNYDITDIKHFPEIIKNTKGLKGLNVTIPYKQEVMPYLNKIKKKAKAIGAVNTIKVTKTGNLVGYNTDYYGFLKSIEPYIKPYHMSALILGTGGASKAIAYALSQLDIPYHYVSRTKSKGVTYTYETLTPSIIQQHKIIVNCTPLGTFPDVNVCPNIPYEGITKHHILFDLIYNPEITKFLKHGNDKEATTVNGSKMLELQAEKSWEIWGLAK